MKYDIIVTDGVINMEKHEKEALLNKKVDDIPDNEIDEYINKYVKIKKVNFAKVVAIATVPTILLTGFSGLFMNKLLDVKSKDYTTKYYNVCYVDSDSNDKVIIDKNVEQHDIKENVVIIKSPWKEENNLYKRDITKLTTTDDISSEIDSLIKHDYDDVMEVLDSVEHRSEITEFNAKPNLDNNEEKVSIVYNDFLEEKTVLKDEEYRKGEKAAMCTAICVPSFIGTLIFSGVLAPSSDSYAAYKEAKLHLKSLKKRKKKNV